MSDAVVDTVSFRLFELCCWWRTFACVVLEVGGCDTLWVTECVRKSVCVCIYSVSMVCPAGGVSILSI